MSSSGSRYSKSETSTQVIIGFSFTRGHGGGSDLGSQNVILCKSVCNRQLAGLPYAALSRGCRSHPLRPCQVNANIVEKLSFLEELCTSAATWPRWMAIFRCGWTTATFLPPQPP